MNFCQYDLNFDFVILNIPKTPPIKDKIEKIYKSVF